MKNISGTSRTRIATTLLLTLFVTLGCAQESGGQESGGASQEDAGVTVTLTNIESVAWEVTGVEGAEGVAELNTRNPALSLTVGTRYRFDNNGGAAHPLDFRNERSRFLLAQGGPEGSFEGDPEVDFIDDEEGVTFTLTQALADEIAIYYCTVHPDMVGDVEVASGE